MRGLAAIGGAFVIGLACIVAACLLALNGHDVPEQFLTLPSVALGILGGVALPVVTNAKPPPPEQDPEAQRPPVQYRPPLQGPPPPPPRVS